MATGPTLHDLYVVSVLMGILSLAPVDVTLSVSSMRYKDIYKGE